MKIELLLPAGNWDCLKAAVENGADAVYLGVDQFNARQRAGNFKLSEMNQVIDYCHNQGVKVCCTLNILIKNQELTDFFEVVRQLYNSGVDAVIIQEISFLPLIKQNFPGLEVHISTQAAITNSYHLPLIKSADKIILPREFNKEQIKNFIKKTGLPIEIFVQGALCFSYSGKCLFSSFLGGRSGNRGYCAQPCRKKYNGKYLLSMKDLCLVNRIPEIIQLGIKTIKIEGRLRSSKYVAATTKLYRTAIDSYYQNNFQVSPQLFKEMELAFNREFTEGYFSSEKELVATDQPFSRGLFLGIIENNNLIKLEEELEVGDGVGIWSQDKVDGAIIRRIELDDQIVIKAKKGDTVKLFIRALPGTKIYKTSSVKENSQIKFETKPKIILHRELVKKINLLEIKPTISKKEELLVKVYSRKDAEQALQQGATTVFYNLFSSDFQSKYGAYIPRILTDSQVEEAIKKINEQKIKKILIGDLGVYAQLKKEEGLDLYLDYSNNLFNDIDVNFFYPAIPIISPELNFEELKEFKNKNFAVLIQGKIILMNTKYPRLPSKITDEKEFSFPVRKEQDYYQILNSRELGLFEAVIKLKKVGITKFYLDLDHNVAKTVNLYHQLLQNKKSHIEKKGYTKGHWEETVN